MEEIDEFRGQACKTALEIISTRGVDCLTLRTLGQALGCSYAKPYRYFGNKHQLIDAVRGHAFELFASFMALAQTDEDRRLSMGRYVEFARQHSAAFEVMFGFNQSFVSAETRASEDRAWAVCTQPIREEVAAGRLMGDPERIAHVLWVSLHGISTLALSDKLTHGMDEEALLDELVLVLDLFRKLAA